MPVWSYKGESRLKQGAIKTINFVLQYALRPHMHLFLLPSRAYTIKVKGEKGIHVILQYTLVYLKEFKPAVEWYYF